MQAVAALVAILAVACGGTAGVRDHSAALAASTHCDQHGCATPPSPVNLGEGCYAVENHLYQCSTDGPGDASCFEVPPCAEVCENTVRDARGFEISTKRCESLWSDYSRAHQPPPVCEPVVVTALGSAAGYASSHLDLPTALVLDVMRAGKSKLAYEARACATGDAVSVGEPTRATGFAALDSALRSELARATLPSGECADITLLASHFECH